MSETKGSTVSNTSARMSESELAELIEAADASTKAFQDTQVAQLMDSMAIGTGFDIAMVQQVLLPPTASIDIESFPAEPHLAASTAIEAGVSTDAGDTTANDACAALTTFQIDPNPLVTHHQHY